VTDGWSLYVVARLGNGELRFTELKRSIDGVSQRMLTVTLRGLERDGLVTRTIYSAMPPNIAYRLTPMGATLLGATNPWSRGPRTISRASTPHGLTTTPISRTTINTLHHYVAR
jgi:DNA-binding HxlR family transcriptional regulator